MRSIPWGGSDTGVQMYKLRGRVTLPCLLVVWLTLVTAPAAEERPRRFPVDVAWRGPELLIANRCGTLVTLIPGTGQIVQELPVGAGLSDLALAPSGKFALVADEQQSWLMLLVPAAGGTWTTAAELKLPATPVTVCLAADESWASVACLWARQVAIVRIATTAHPALRLDKTVDLPFAPRKQWFAPAAGRLLVADSFGGQLAILDPRAPRPVAGWRLPGRNIRGLAASDDGNSLVVALQFLNEHVPTERDRIFWGSVVSSHVLTISLDELLAATAPPTEPYRPIAHWSTYPLGEAKRGAGDPADLAILPGGAWVVALGGVGEVLARRSGNIEPLRCRVGPRPMALAASQQHIFVANYYDDSIAVIDQQSWTLVRTLSLGDTPPLSLAAQGEQLFHDARLSLDGWYSCHSCHTDGHANGARNDNLGDGDYGAPKRIVSLLGVGATAPWAWNGGQSQLAPQIRKSIALTMHGAAQRPPNEQEIEALGAYLASLVPPPGVDRARRRSDPARVARGRTVFDTKGCMECHAPPYYTSAEMYDVGLTDENRRSRFNPPSLLGVSQRDAWLHDGRATRLRDVFGRHQHPPGTVWTDEQLEDLLAFLRDL